MHCTKSTLCTAHERIHREKINRFLALKKQTPLIFFFTKNYGKNHLFLSTKKKQITVISCSKINKAYRENMRLRQKQNFLFKQNHIFGSIVDKCHHSRGDSNVSLFVLLLYVFVFVMSSFFNCLLYVIFLDWWLKEQIEFHRSILLFYGYVLSCCCGKNL